MANKELINSIVDAIIAEIHRGKSYVTEFDLSVTLKVSRTRLRESIQTLQAYGIITKRQKCGITLAQPNRNSLRESYLLREMLEKFITDAVLKNVTERDCDKLEKIDSQVIEAMKEQDYPALLRHNLEFHHAFVDIGQMKIASQILRNLHYLNYAYMAPLIHKLNVTSEPQVSHREIIDSLRRRDTACYKLVKQHLNQGRKFLMKHCPAETSNTSPEIVI